MISKKRFAFCFVAMVGSAFLVGCDRKLNRAPPIKTTEALANSKPIGSAAIVSSSPFLV